MRRIRCSLGAALAVLTVGAPRAPGGAPRRARARRIGASLGASLAALAALACGPDPAPPASPLVSAPPPRTLVVEGSNVCAVDGAAVRCACGAGGFGLSEIATGVSEIASLAGSRALVILHGALCGVGATEAGPGPLRCLPQRTVDRPIAHVARTVDGVVFADASGAVWRLAEGDPEPAGTPHLSGAVMVGAPYGWLCALSRDGRVACLADRDLTVPPVPLPVTDVVRISSGWPFCVVRAGGDLLCERHAPDATPSLDDLEPVGLSDVTDVVSASGRACALRASGAVHCFEAAPPGAAWAPGPAVIDDGVELAEGTLELRCARRRSGEIACWGDDPDGLFVDRSPARRVGLDDAIDVALGEAHGCAVRRTGAVACWGGVGATALAHPELAFPVRSATPVPVEVGVEGAVELELGERVLCARTAEGEVGCATPAGAARPAWLPPAARVAELSGRCARTQDGAVYCAGVGAETPVLTRTSGIATYYDEVCGVRGELVACTTVLAPPATDPFETARTARRRYGAYALASAVRLVGGPAALCGVGADGHWRCVGHNGVGQLGAPPSRPSITPLDFGTEAWDGLALGARRTCVWRAGEPLRCAGVLPDGSPRTPLGDRGDGALTELPAVRGVRAVALGPHGALAAMDDGSVMSWGIDEHGELGGGGTREVRVPTTLLLREPDALSPGAGPDLPSPPREPAVSGAPGSEAVPAPD